VYEKDAYDLIIGNVSGISDDANVDWQAVLTRQQVIRLQNYSHKV